MANKQLKHTLSIVSVAAVVLVCVLLRYLTATAAGLQDRKLRFDNPATGADHVTYTVNFTPTAASIGSIKLEFCKESPIPDEICTHPNRPSLASAVLTSQTGETGFTISNASTDNTIILTRSPATAAGVPIQLVFEDVINQPQRGAGYLRISTYASNDASGISTDTGGVAYVIGEELQLTTEVPPYLEFCVAAIISGLDCSSTVGSVADFGYLSTTSTAIAASQMAAATNADSGYSISYFGTTMTSGNHTIAALSDPTISLLGVSQFGMNLRANTMPQVGSEATGSGTGVASARYSIPNMYTFASGDTVATANDVSSFTKYTSSYIVNVSGAQPAGYYATTISYVCLGNF